MTKEIELRYRLIPGEFDQISNQLKKEGWSAQASRQEDIYYCAAEYVERGDTAKCPYVVRIRILPTKSLLAFKSFASNGGWIEHETEIKDPQVMAKILEGTGEKPYLRIQKQRLSGSVRDIEVNIDQIEALGDFIELEIMGDDLEMGRAEIAKFAATLGLNPDRIISKGYIQLMEEAGVGKIS